MRTTTAVLGLLVAFGLVACEQQLPTDATDASATAAITSVDAPTLGNQVVDKVSAGGNDACEVFADMGFTDRDNGCDGNWSLSARMKEDGTVSGQFNDTFAGGGLGVHGEITCLSVVGNAALMSGVITKGSPAEGVDWTGLNFLVGVVDNGTSSQDTPDQISFTLAYTGFATCEFFDPATWPYLVDLYTGQVKVWGNETDTADRLDPQTALEAGRNTKRPAIGAGRFVFGTRSESRQVRAHLTAATAAPLRPSTPPRPRSVPGAR